MKNVTGHNVTSTTSTFFLQTCLMSKNVEKWQNVEIIDRGSSLVLFKNLELIGKGKVKKNLIRVSWFPSVTTLDVTHQKILLLLNHQGQHVKETV